MSDIKRIVCTHGHPDHIGGVQEIARASGAKVLMHPADMERLRIRFREVISGRPAPGAIIAYLTQAPTDVTGARGRRRAACAGRAPRAAHAGSHSGKHLLVFGDTSAADRR